MTGGRLGVSLTPPCAPPDPPEVQLVLVACGPFTPAGSLGYQPLGDLLQEVARLRPALCVLVRGRGRGEGTAPTPP